MSKNNKIIFEHNLEAESFFNISSFLGIYMSLNTLVSVANVNLAELFVELYNSAKIFNHEAVITITRGDAERILTKQRIFAKFCGKYMFVDLSVQ